MTSKDQRKAQDDKPDGCVIFFLLIVCWPLAIVYALAHAANRKRPKE